MLEPRLHGRAPDDEACRLHLRGEQCREIAAHTGPEDHDPLRIDARTRFQLLQRQPVVRELRVIVEVGAVAFAVADACLVGAHEHHVRLRGEELEHRLPAVVLGVERVLDRVTRQPLHEIDRWHTARGAMRAGSDRAQPRTPGHLKGLVEAGDAGDIFERCGRCGIADRKRRATTTNFERDRTIAASVLEQAPASVRAGVGPTIDAHDDVALAQPRPRRRGFSLQACHTQQRRVCGVAHHAERLRRRACKGAIRHAFGVRHRSKQKRCRSRPSMHEERMPT
jgi:hypothetical protein